MVFQINVVVEHLLNSLSSSTWLFALSGASKVSILAVYRIKITSGIANRQN